MTCRAAWRSSAAQVDVFVMVADPQVRAALAWVS
jgi:hypothetical protein